jgi:integrase
VQRRLGHANIHTTEQYLHEIEPESHPTEALPW